jgi:hypothetical protein
MTGVAGWQRVPLGQAFVQAPQFPESVLRSRHVPPQSVNPCSQTHCALTQTLPPAHTLPPHFVGGSSKSGMQVDSFPLVQHRSPFFPPTTHETQPSEQV